MDAFLIKATQLILALAFLVVIHEFGHFLFARMFGTKVDKFYIFFNPRLSLLKWKPGEYLRLGAFWKKDKPAPDAPKPASDAPKSAEEEDPGHEICLWQRDLTGGDEKKPGKKPGFWSDTEYGIGWLPLGGYCAINGMVDESMNTEQLNEPPKPYEFRSKPAWQRLLIMAAGVLFNFLLAILIYAGLVYVTGEKYVPVNEAKMGMNYSGMAQRAGFRDGDIPLMADGRKLDNPADALQFLMQADKVTVLRDGREHVIDLPSDFMLRLDQEAKSDTLMFPMMTYRLPATVSQVSPGDGADKAGIRVGDRFISVDGRPTPDMVTFMRSLRGHEGKSVPVTYIRGNDTIAARVALNDGSKMGIALQADPSEFYTPRVIHYNIFESVPRGIQMGTDKLVAYAKSMKLVFTKEGAKSIGGFGAIGSIFPDSWDWIAFWNITAFLSVALAFMNFLPIPALDGGHIFFTLYEVITRRKLSLKFQERAQIFGMWFLLALLIYANGMDIYRFFIK